MVVHDLDRVGAVVLPDEGNAPLAVDPDRILARAIAA
jgi:hypothetical protein